MNMKELIICVVWLVVWGPALYIAETNPNLERREKASLLLALSVGGVFYIVHFFSLFSN